MNIAVINGTEYKGCTYKIKDVFLEPLRNSHSIEEFYLPKDCPQFCCGCKQCFFKDETLCPHAKYTLPIWDAMLEADLIVFTYPVYALRSPGQVKALLDHLCCHWMVHRPDKKMFSKRAVILTQSIGAPNGSAQKDVATSLTWMGVPDIKKLGFGLMEGVIWDDLSIKRRQTIERKIKRLTAKYMSPKKAHKSLKVKALFAICKMLHKKTLKSEKTLSADNRHWLDNGWIKNRPDAIS